VVEVASGDDPESVPTEAFCSSLRNTLMAACILLSSVFSTGKCQLNAIAKALEFDGGSHWST
jgi:hypothetical protein